MFQESMPQLMPFYSDPQHLLTREPMPQTDGEMLPLVAFGPVVSGGESESFTTSSSDQTFECGGTNRCLGTDFVPGPWDVVCGRGKGIQHTTGNRRFRVLIANRMNEYTRAHQKRSAKSAIVDSVISQIHEANGDFVRQEDGGAWYRLPMSAIRDKVGYVLRVGSGGGVEGHGSSANKRKRRQEEDTDESRAMAAQQEMLVSSLEDEAESNNKRVKLHPYFFHK